MNEGAVGGFLTAIYNFVGIVFLFLFFIPALTKVINYVITQVDRPERWYYFGSIKWFWRGTGFDGMVKVFNGSQPLAMSNDPLHPMLLMVVKQPLMPIEWQWILKSNNPLLVTETSFRFTIK